VPSGKDVDSQEAEFGSAQGGPGKVDQWDGSHSLCSRGRT